LLIAYNASGSFIDPADADRISEDAVQDEVASVLQAAERLGYPAEMLAVSDIAEDIKRIGDFRPDVVVNLCEGFRGVARDEMHMAGLWELMRLPYTGNSALSLGLSQDKVLCKRLFESRKIHTPPYQVFRDVPHSTYLKFPVIAKPAMEDASLGVTQQSVTDDFGTLQSIVRRLIDKYRQPVLVEQYIAGRELNVSILDNPEPGVLAVGEIDFSRIPEGYQAITSYEAKWMPDHPLYARTPALYPARIDLDLRERLCDAALQVYRLLGGRDYGRVDTRVDAAGRIYVLEYNPNPDISMEAGYVKALQAAGLSYGTFVEILIQNALKRSGNGQHQGDSAR